MSRISAANRRVRLTVAAVAVGTVAALGIAAPSLAGPATDAPAHAAEFSTQKTRAAGITREEMLRRAATWLTANNGAQVPYSQNDVWSDGYRQDCSGYVSMTLGLSKPGPNTVGLAGDRSITTPIALADLKPGDLLIDADGSNTTRHVVIFEGWTDGSHSAYSAFEQRGGHGTDHRRLTYGLDQGSEFKPYRPVNLTN